MNTPVSRMVPIGLFTLAASVGMVFALLHELKEAHDLSAATLGWMAGVAFFAAVVSQLVLAPFADRGHARRVMVLGIIGAAVASISFALASEPWQFIAARIVAGLSFGAFLPAAQAVVTSADPDRAGEHLGRLAGIQIAGFIIGPGIGALIVEVAGLDAPFYALTIVLLVVLPRIATMHVDEVEPDPDGAQGTLAIAAEMVTGMRRIIRRRDALAATILTAALQLPAGMYEAIWAVFMEDLGASTTFIGLSLTFYGIPFIIAAPIGGRLADERGPLRMLPIALVIIIPLTILYGFLTIPLMLMAFAGLEAIGNGLGLPAAQGLMASATADGERATGQALASSAGQLMAGLTAVVASLIFDAYGPRWTFFGVAMAVLLLGGIGMAVGLSGGVAKRDVPPRTGHPQHIRGGGR